MPSGPHRTGRASAPPGWLFVDSGAWIALRNRRDQYHAEADRLVRAAVEARTALLTTTLVLAETHRVTLFRVGVRAALRGLERIDASPRVTVHFPGTADHAAARRWLERLAPRPVTYTDAVSFAVMEAAGCRHSSVSITTSRPPASASGGAEPALRRGPRPRIILATRGGRPR